MEKFRHTLKSSGYKRTAKNSALIIIEDSGKFRDPKLFLIFKISEVSVQFVCKEIVKE